MNPCLFALAIRSERDIVLARQRSKQIAGILGFDGQDQTRIATAVSEIARNAYQYAGQGMVEFRVEGSTSPQVLVIRVADPGPGIPNLDEILEGRYRSRTGMGVGIVGASRLVDKLDVTPGERMGTVVTLTKLLPARASFWSTRSLLRLTGDLLHQKPLDPVEEVQRQNQELLLALDELTRRRDELTILNRELEDTNRGVVALYAELDEKADHLRRADELKSRFLSNMTHEFRTPVNSIQALARLLLDRADGNLTPEQERQVSFIQRAADDLSELVNDLLDLAKVEAGKSTVRPAMFDVGNLFGALRGMLRPLLVNESVALVFEDPADLPPMFTDEGKVSQILRNFISNALKFTERGEVCVSARRSPDGESIRFAVRDTGIGIAPEDQERIFQEFTQVDNRLQRKVRGTGLGLPLCRRLAGLLGGTVGIESVLGAGSTFTADIPLRYQAAHGAAESWDVDPGRVPVLVVEDSDETVMIYERYLATSGFQLFHARTVREAWAVLQAVTPRAVVLDVLLQGEDSWGFLTELRRRHKTEDLPVMVMSSVDDTRKGLALGADLYFVKPIDRQRLIQALTRLTSPGSMRRVMIVDDEEISRYVLRQHLAVPTLEVLEVSSGDEAIREAARQRPHVICLDLMMPQPDGVEVLRRLKHAQETRDIPVVVVTSKALAPGERRDLSELACAVVSKESISREGVLAVVEDALKLGTSAA
ncbi:MAG TPA: ATP-binding protein [Candidatus Eisenbacteria bacterium]|nr:ATP-binding protein [Candidatus Eisenbacteria bacterium]